MVLYFFFQTQRYAAAARAYCKITDLNKEASVRNENL